MKLCTRSFLKLINLIFLPFDKAQGRRKIQIISPSCLSFVEGSTGFRKNSTIVSIVVSMAVCFQIAAIDKKLIFIDANFDDFAARVMKNEDDRALFRVYFNNLMQKIQEAHEAAPEKEKATYRYLHALALDTMKEKHGDWYQEIYPFVADVRFTLDEQFDDTRRVIKFFLSRYGAYEEFLQFKACEQAQGSLINEREKTEGIWNKIKSYASATKDTVASWFGFGSNDVSSMQA